MRDIVKQSQQVFLLFLLTILAFFLRFLGQPTIPYGFHRDEAGILYSAYSIVETGRDEWGRFMPLHFKALGDYPPGIYNYLVALTIPIVGLVPLAERLPAIIFGSLLVPLSFLFINSIFKNKKIALLSAFLITISPWDIVQSRAGSEALVALVFSILGMWCFYLAIKHSRPKLIIITLISYFLALYSYNAARVGLPLLHGMLVWYLWPDLKQKQFRRQLMLIITLFIFSIASVFATPGRQMSFQNTSIFTHPNLSSVSEIAFIRESSLRVPAVVSRVFSNKPVNIIYEFIDNYFSYFSFGFLFNDAGFHKRYLVPRSGPLLVILLPFIILGLSKYSELKRREKLLLIGWILLAPIAAAVTEEATPNVKRSMYLFFPLLILAAAGFIGTIKLLKSQPQSIYYKKYLPNIVICTTLLVLGWNFAFFTKQYVIHTKYETVHHRSYGYFEVFAKTEALEDQYERVYVYENVDTPHLYYLITQQFPPQQYQQIPTEQKRDLFMTEKPNVNIDQYTFVPHTCPLPEEIREKALYVLPAGCFNNKKLTAVISEVELVNSTDDMPLFYLAHRSTK